jgi:hypothetical protein
MLMSLSVVTPPKPVAPISPVTPEDPASLHGHLDFNRITDEQFQAAADHMGLEPEIQALLR